MVILKNDFETKIGTIRTSIHSDYEEFNVKADNLTIETTGHKITLEIIDLKNGLTPKEISIDTSIGWRWYIEKTNTKTEKITIQCKLINPKTNSKFGSSSGEYLDAIEIENETHHLHIGTEDTDALCARAQDDDWLPKRFENKLGLHRNKVLDFTEYIDFGFKTNIPSLNKDEKIYFHYLVATKKTNIHDYENQDVHTWLAVEKSKKEIDEHIKNVC